MADNIGKRKGIPAWNGDLSLWPKYREDMQIWMDGEDFQVLLGLEVYSEFERVSS